MGELSVPKVPTDQILRHLAEGTAAATGEAFMCALVQSLAAALGVKWAFVTELASRPGRVRMLAYWMRGALAHCVEYDLQGTPCESVLRGEIGYFPAGVHQLFPKDPWVVRDRIESFLAIPMTLADGTVIGHLAAADDLPMKDLARELQIFRIFGARAAAEFQRQEAQRALIENERRLAAVLGSAMDAVITIDADRRIVMFNEAAERSWRCSAAWAIGQPIDRFVVRRDRPALNLYFERQPRDGEGSLWIPEGLHAERADGQEFPVEATVSSLRIGSEQLHTIILRDLTERAAAAASTLLVRNENHQLIEVLERNVEDGSTVAEAPAMKELLSQLSHVAQADSTVLISGETGVGKEGIARSVHRGSPRSNRPLVTVNCAAMPATLIESELFGHERGAFTGATTQRKGRFELADGGTLFLDEVGELSLSSQAKLLRVLQDQTFERVGGTQTIRVDVRLIAATNRKLLDMVSAGQFRADLYYRLSVFPLHVPPLRERREDIPALARLFVAQMARKLSKPISGVAPLSLMRLVRYDWPGNVRELQNVIERAAVLTRSSVLEIPDAMLDSPPDGVDERETFRSLEEVLAAHVMQTLERCGGVIEGPRGAAAQLGLKPSTLRHRIKLLGIVKPRRIGASLGNRESSQS